MQERRYLLSLAELLEDGDYEERQGLAKQGLKWLDGERLDRLKRMSREEVPIEELIPGKRKMAECLGAGLLLQLAVQQAALGERKEALGQCSLEKLEFSNLLELLEQSGRERVPLEYSYGEAGKPYLKNFPFYFNLSHSGKYVFCAISDRELGVDIQLEKPLGDERIAGRFFAEEEKRALAECTTERERQQLFFRLWVCKEACGKLTGRGLVELLGKNLYQPASHQAEAYQAEVYQIEAYQIELYCIEEYRLAVCKWKQES